MEVGSDRSGEPAGADAEATDDLGPEGTRERILRIAVSLFYEHGYHGTSLSAIAKEVGISAPALYWHFDSKEELCLAAVQAELTDFVDQLRSGMQRSTPDERLDGFVRSYVKAKLEQSGRLSSPGASGSYGMLRDALSEEYRAPLDALQREVLEMLRAILEEGREAGDFRFVDTTATAFAIVNMCEYSFVWVRPGGRLGHEAVAELYGDLALAMVRARGYSTPLLNER